MNGTRLQPRRHPYDGEFEYDWESPHFPISIMNNESTFDGHNCDWWTSCWWEFNVTFWGNESRYNDSEPLDSWNIVYPFSKDYCYDCFNGTYREGWCMEPHPLPNGKIGTPFLILEGALGIMLFTVVTYAVVKLVQGKMKSGYLFESFNVFRNNDHKLFKTRKHEKAIRAREKQNVQMRAMDQESVSSKQDNNVASVTDLESGRYEQSQSSASVSNWL